MSESEPPLSLEKIAKTAKALQEIAEALTMAYAIVGRRIRPEYKECAKNFLKILEDVYRFHPQPNGVLGSLLLFVVL